MPLARAAATTGAIFLAIASQRTFEPPHQWRSQTSQITMAVSATGEFLGQVRLGDGRAPLVGLDAGAELQRAGPLGLRPRGGHPRFPTWPWDLARGRPRRGRWRPAGDTRRSRSRRGHPARCRRRGPRCARGSRRRARSPRGSCRSGGAGVGGERGVLVEAPQGGHPLDAFEDRVAVGIGGERHAGRQVVAAVVLVVAAEDVLVEVELVLEPVARRAEGDDRPARFGVFLAPSRAGRRRSSGAA